MGKNVAEPDLGGSGFGRIPLQIHIYFSYLFFFFFKEKLKSDFFFFLMRVIACDRLVLSAWRTERSGCKLTDA